MRKGKIGARQGAVFGFMEGIVMLMGVLIGLAATGERRIAVIGVLVAGVADAFANTAGFYASEESEKIHTKKEIALSSLFCLISTIAATAIILVPLIFLEMKTAIYFSFAVAIVTLLFIGLYISRQTKQEPWKVVAKYITMGVITAFATHYAGLIIISLV